MEIIFKPDISKFFSERDWPHLLWLSEKLLHPKQFCHLLCY